MKRIVFAGGCMIFSAVIPAGAAKVTPPVVQATTVKVPLGCELRVVRDHRYGKVRVHNELHIINTTPTTIPIGTPVYYTATRSDGSPLSTYLQLYIKLDPGKRYTPAVSGLKMDAGCQAWIVQKVGPPATQ